MQSQILEGSLGLLLARLTQQEIEPSSPGVGFDQSEGRRLPSDTVSLGADHVVPSIRCRFGSCRSLSAGIPG